MGAWGNLNFDNDDALDFLDSVQEQGKNLLTSTIFSFAAKKNTDYIEATEASECLAAIEYFAASKGRPTGDFPAEANDWFKMHLALPLLILLC